MVENISVGHICNIIMWGMLKYQDKYCRLFVKGKLIDIGDVRRGRGLYSINVGILPYIYDQFNNHHKVSLQEKYKLLPTKLKHEKSNSREKAYIFSVIIGMLYKHKTLHNYKSHKTRKLISKTMSISERSYFRYTKYCITHGFAEIDINNSDLLRFKSHNRLGQAVNTECEEFFSENLGGHKHFKLDHTRTVDVKIEHLDFKYVLYFMRLVFIKYEENRKKKSINNNIAHSKKRGFSPRREEKGAIRSKHFFVSYENDKNRRKQTFTGTRKSDGFNDLYKFVFSKTRRREATDLGNYFLMERHKGIMSREDHGKFLHKYGLDEMVEFGGMRGCDQNTTRDFLEKSDVTREDIVGEKISYDTQEAFTKRQYWVDELRKTQFKAKTKKLQEKYSKQRENCLKHISKLDEAIANGDFLSDMAYSISRDFGSYQGLLKNDKSESLRVSSKEGSKWDKTRISNTKKATNTMSLVKLNEESVLMDTYELRYLNSISILSPQQYYKTLCCDFDLNYRLGYGKISKLFGITKGQVSRMLNVMGQHDLLETSRRFVYLSSFNSNNPREAINKMNTQYSVMRNKEDGSLTHPAFNRLIYRHGCLLYEVEGVIQSNVEMSFRSSGHLDNVLGGDDVQHQAKYGKLSKRIFGKEATISRTQYNQIFENETKAA